MNLVSGQDVRVFNAKSAPQTNKQICLERANAGQRTRTDILRVKVKVTLEQATKAQGEVEVQLYSFFNLGAR